MRFSLITSQSVSDAPFCIGFAFRRGDIPAGQTAIASIAGVQVTPKNFWTDGSLKYAVVAGRASLAAEVPLTIELRASAAPVAGTVLTLSDLKATNATASIGCGPFGTVSWSGADWDAPFVQWVSGDRMSSWVYRKPVGSDLHLVAWLEVRLFAGGAVEILPWIENGYLRVAGPTSKSATFTFSLANSLRFSRDIALPHHCRTPLVDGTNVSHWLGADPGVVPRHDVGYLQSTELVPSYWATTSLSSLPTTAVPSTFVPLQAGGFRYDGDSMASTGYQDPIGLLPQHDVLYLTCNSPAAVYRSVVWNGYSAGRYPIHYRDETSNRPLRFSAYPTLVISDGSGFKDNGGSTTSSYTPAVSGVAPPGWDVAHSPSVGFMAYLVTGRWYFMEEAQFAATANYLGKSDNAQMRTGSQALVQTAVQAWQTRSCAWDWRALVQALTVTPDDDQALRGEFIAAVENNVNHFHSRYVARPNNPFGWILPGETYNDRTGQGAPWQQDFVTAVFGYSLSLDLPISAIAASKLASFFQWKAKSTVGRLGTSSDWWYVNGFPYNQFVSTAAVPDYVNGTGPWLDSWRASYDATYATPPSWFGGQEGVLAFEYIGSPTVGMFANIQPAIAYAARHKVPGAYEAYSRMTNASNWRTLAAAFDGRPAWAVRPAL